MKLYATTTSERASKGQGGNKRLDTIITDANRNEIVKILIQINEDDTIALQYWDNTTSRGNKHCFTSNPIMTSKGNKQKGEYKSGDICNFNACKNRAVIYGVCEKHKSLEV